MRPGYDEHMAQVHRMYVEKGNGVVGFEHARGRQVACDNLAKEAVGIARAAHGSCGSWKPGRRCPRDQPGCLANACGRSQALAAGTTAGLVGAFGCSSAPKSEITAIGAASPWRT